LTAPAKPLTATKSSKLTYRNHLTMVKLTTFAVISAFVHFTSAFAPVQVCRTTKTELAAESRRDVLGAIGLVFLGGAAVAAGTNSEKLTLLAGMRPPSLETFHSKSKKGAQFIPGKGLRSHDDELLAGMRPPSLETFHSKSKKGAQYIPGKGLRSHDENFLA
jgi:hypothetical protein